MSTYVIDISTLPYLSVADRDALPACAAVYLVMERNKVLYVGQTRHLKRRWINHHLLGILEAHIDARIVWYACEDNVQRWQLENKAAAMFRPRYNKALVPRIPTQKTVSALVSNHLYDVLQAMAEREGTPISVQVRALILEGLEARGILVLSP